MQLSLEQKSGFGVTKVVTSTTTGSDGSYTLKVAPGRWEVGYDFISTEGDAPPYIVQPPKRVRIKGDGEQKS